MVTGKDNPACKCNTRPILELLMTLSVSEVLYYNLLQSWKLHSHIHGDSSVSCPNFLTEVHWESLLVEFGRRPTAVCTTDWFGWLLCLPMCHWLIWVTTMPAYVPLPDLGDYYACLCATAWFGLLLCLPMCHCLTWVTAMPAYVPLTDLGDYCVCLCTTDWFGWLLCLPMCHWLIWVTTMPAYVPLTDLGDYCACWT